MFGAILGFAGSLFGARRQSRDTRRTNRTNERIAREAAERDRANFLENREYERPINQRARLEEAGLNPISFGISGPTGAYAASTPVATMQTPRVGAMISDAFVGFGEAFDRRATAALQRTNLELQNQRLTRQVHDMTVRPASRSVYQSRGTRSVPGVNSSTKTVSTRVASNSDSTVGRNRRGDWDRWLNPDRDSEVHPVADTPGTFTISNTLTDRWAGGPITVAGDAGEPWGLGERLGVAVDAAPQIYRHQRARLDRERVRRIHQNAVTSTQIPDWYPEMAPPMSDADNPKPSIYIPYLRIPQETYRRGPQ